MKQNGKGFNSSKVKRDYKLSIEMEIWVILRMYVKQYFFWPYLDTCIYICIPRIVYLSSFFSRVRIIEYFLVYVSDPRKNVPF